jgi:hypothetical protein
MIPVSEPPKTFHASNREATVIGLHDADFENVIFRAEFYLLGYNAV